MKVALFYLPNVKYGGWPTYTAHLYHGLKLAGHEPHLLRIGNKTEKKFRSWGRGISYQNVSLLDAVNIAFENKTIITATTQKFDKETEALVNVGATVILHDPTELKGAIPNILKTCKDVVTIRNINVSNLADLGISSRYLPHPYLRYSKPFGHKMLWAVANSRIDWDKGTHFIVSANDVLPPDKRVRIYGAMNTMYAYHKLPNTWENYYKGTFPVDDLWAGTKLVSKYKWSVDMSTINKDGGGTQYTFLEAIDAGTGLLLNDKWRTGRSDDEMADAATFVNPEELAEALKEPPKIFGDHILANHDAKDVAIKTLSDKNA